MRNALYLFIFIYIMLAAMVGCTDSGKDKSRKTSPSDTLYTQKRAMAIYGYQPERALRIIDSAVIVGNLSQVSADYYRAKIYSYTQMGSLLDSLLPGDNHVRFDSARAIGERLLEHDSIKGDIRRHQRVLEILVYTARQQEDTTHWFQRSNELIDVCRQLGAETEALRTEAELAASLCYMGQQKTGLAKLDTVIDLLGSSEPFRFNELDALIIALKRKIGVLEHIGQHVETMPLSHRIIRLLDDYAQHPANYHDGSCREPIDSTDRDDYIRFYRTQAQNHITVANSAISGQGGMEESFLDIEKAVREATAREHIARYNALEQRIKANKQQMEVERHQARAERSLIYAVGATITALLAIGLAFVVIKRKRDISEKNRALVRQIEETMRYKEKYEGSEKSSSVITHPVSLNDDQLFSQLSTIIEGERLYLDPKFDRQTLIDRYGLSKDRIGAAFTKGSEHPSLPAYINKLRLEHAYQLLLTRPDLNLEQVAIQSGFSSRNYFSDRFRQHFGISPTEFRHARR